MTFLENLLIRVGFSSFYFLIVLFGLVLGKEYFSSRDGKSGKYNFAGLSLTEKIIIIVVITTTFAFLFLAVSLLTHFSL